MWFIKNLRSPFAAKSGQNVLLSIFNAFKNRTLSDGGIFEADQCAITNINNLYSIDLV